jgi:hypothetical protein
LLPIAINHFRFFGGGGGGGVDECFLWLSFAEQKCTVLVEDVIVQEAEKFGSPEKVDLGGIEANSRQN